ncbi:transcriptional repressor LexA [Endozoicomonadaceae bacterium StTr2]
MKNRLTPRQAEILALIQQHIEESGFPPTRAEIARTFGFRSPNAAEEHLRALARKGAIEITPGTSRGIRIPEPVNQGLPIVGQVAAGSPILAQEHIEDYCQLNPEFFSPKADYFLRVKGMSMKDAGILDGDLLAVHRTREARNGQIVVARLDDDVTVKRFEKQGRTILLHPENEEFETIVVEGGDFIIEGLSVGVIRH